MECDKDITLSYVRDVFDNLLQVIESGEFMGNEDNFKALKDRVNIFYLSLFHHTEGKRSFIVIYHDILFRHAYPMISQPHDPRWILKYVGIIPANMISAELEAGVPTQTG